MTLPKLGTTIEFPPETVSQLTQAEGGRTLERDPLATILGPQPLASGQSINRYRLISLLGRGTMGAVWKVLHETLQCERALKIIYLDPGRSADLSRRFLLEAQTLAKLSHRRTVAIHDARIEGTFALIETELLKGISLDRHPNRGQPAPPRWAIDAALQICDALAAAHKLRIIHRDLKPSNVMLTASTQGEPPSLKVLDFGLTKWLDDDNSPSLFTRPGDVLGTPAYLSPEQARGEQVDHRCDLYSLGVMLYELLTGRRPFGGSLFALLRAHCETPPTPPSALGLDLDWPPGLESLVLRCLAKRPDDRPESSERLADELATIRAYLAS